MIIVIVRSFFQYCVGDGVGKAIKANSVWRGVGVGYSLSIALNSGPYDGFLFYVII